jgi:hypothetical protein
MFSTGNLEIEWYKKRRRKRKVSLMQGVRKWQTHISEINRDLEVERSFFY